jgi:hypothetical protein
LAQAKKILSEEREGTLSLAFQLTVDLPNAFGFTKSHAFITHSAG